MTPATAPTAPGALGVAARPEEMFAYLEALTQWVGDRRRELDELDQAILASPTAASHTPDLTLALGVWEAVRLRLEQLRLAWDSGRVTTADLERLSTLVWGRLDSGRGTQIEAARGLAVTLPEACRLSDALAAQLRGRLGLAPGTDQIAARVAALRAQVERLRYQAALEPPQVRPQAIADVATVADTVDEVAAKAARGADVGGFLPAIELTAAQLERDLIVGATVRRQHRDKLDRVGRDLAEVRELHAQVRALVAEWSRRFLPGPTTAVPDPAALGKLPNTPAGIDDYLQRLAGLRAELMRLGEAAERALAAHATTQRRLEAQRLKVDVLGLTGEAELAALAELIERILQRQPSPTASAGVLLDAYQHLAERLAAPQGKPEDGP